MCAMVSTEAQTNTVASTNVPAAHPLVATNAPHWKTSVAFGLTISRGNSDTTMASATAQTERHWLHNDLVLEADGLYGESRLPNQSTNQAGSTETAEILHGYAQYNHFFGKGFYGYGRIDGYHDGIADIKYRLTLAPGLGYIFVTNKILDFSAEAGPGYIKEQLDGYSQSYASLRFAEQFHYIISPHARVWETVELLPQVDQLNNYILNFQAGIEAGLTKNNKVAMRLVLRDTYNNVPAAGRLKNDLQIIASLAYKF